MFQILGYTCINNSKNVNMKLQFLENEKSILRSYFLSLSLFLSLLTFSPFNSEHSTNNEIRNQKVIQLFHKHNIKQHKQNTNKKKPIEIMLIEFCYSFLIKKISLLQNNNHHLSHHPPRHHSHLPLLHFCWLQSSFIV